MIDLRKLAILLIYQDGTIDYVSIGEEAIHMAYFRELKEKSLRFRTFTEGLDFIGSFHFNIDYFLASQGVIVMLNVSPCVADLIESLPPQFTVILPSDYASEEQRNTFFEISREYIKDWIFFSRFDKEIDGFQEGKIVRNYILEDELMNSSNIGKRK